MNVNLQTCDSRFKSETLHVSELLKYKFLCKLCPKFICLGLPSVQFHFGLQKKKKKKRATTEKSRIRKGRKTATTENRMVPGFGFHFSCLVFFLKGVTQNI